MRTMILETYAMLVCLICIVSLIVLSSIGIYDLVQIIYPEFTSYATGNALLERQYALKSLVKILIMFSVNMAVFSSHWVIGRRARKVIIS